MIFNVTSALLQRWTLHFKISILQLHNIWSIGLYDAAACPLSRFCPASEQKCICESGKYAVGLKPALALSHACPLWNLIWTALIRSSITQYKTHCRYILMHNCKVSNDFYLYSDLCPGKLSADHACWIFFLPALCFTIIQLHTFTVGSSPI